MKTLIALCLVCFAHTTFAQITESDRQNLNLKGNVSFLTERKFRITIKEGKPEKGSLKGKTEYTFDLKGYLAETKYYDDNEKMRGRDYFVYDENGNLTEESNYKADGYRFGSTYYKPDVPNKKREKSRSFSDGTKIDRSIQQFNAQKKLVETQLFNTTDNKPSTKEEVKYDAKGNISKVIRSAEQFGVMSETTYKYDDKGNPTEEIITSFKTKSTQVERVEKTLYTYKYDEKGNWISKTCYETDTTNMTAIIEREITY
jgi:hypothetical protein